MTEPSIRKPTKKAFHFPKGATAEIATDDKQADVALEASGKVIKAVKAAKAKPAAKAKLAAEPKASRRKSAGKAEAAPKAATVAKEKAAPKAKPAPKKEKVVRDSFTMPKSDYAKIAALKQKCLDAGMSVKKSEVLRAGLLLLEGATSQRLLAAISAVETVKTGRPSKS
jgi:hypothetical protein